MATLAAAAALAPDDPIFATIDRYVVADAESSRRLSQEPLPLSSPAHQVWEIKNAPFADAYADARAALVQTLPTTRVGAAALIDFVISGFDGELDSEDAMVLLDTIRDALPSLA